MASPMSVSPRGAESEGETDEGGGDGRDGREDPGREGPVAFDRMEAVGLDVAQVIQQVDAARDEAEEERGSEGREGLDRRDGLRMVAESEEEGGEDDGVLGPLGGPESGDEGGDLPGLRADRVRGWGALCHGWAD